MQDRMLSADDLLHGAIYALEQGGLSISDAVGLWQRGSYASAVILAVFAREEVGRSQICADAWRAVLGGGQVSTKQLAARCDDHVTKITAGRTGTVLRLTPQQSLSLKGLFGDRQTAAYREARRTTDQMIKSLARREPSDTHAIRCRAQYVEPADTGWNRPSQTSRDESRDLITDVAGDYAVRRDYALHTEACTIEGDPTPIGPAARAWANCPTLPIPVWPE